MATEGDVLLERSRLDTRHEMKVGKFSGRDEEWANWALKFEAYTGLLGYEQVMATACDHPGELDYATFSCPAGYVFEGSNNITHYAFCKNWNFIYLFDLSKTCVREFSFHSCFCNLTCLILIFSWSLRHVK